MTATRAPRRRILAAAVSGVLLVPGLTGCGLLDGGSRLEEALEHLPAEADYVTFVDRSAYAERVGVDDIEHGVSAEELGRYFEETEGDVVGTDLARYLGPMQEAAFSELSVDWGAAASTSDGVLVNVWKLLDDVDLEEVGADLEDAGYDADEGDDVDRYSADISAADEHGLVGGRYPQVMAEIAIVADDDLVVAAISADAVTEVLDVVADDADSLSDSGEYDELLDHVEQDGVESATLVTGERVCPDAAGGQATEAQSAAREPLGKPEAVATVVAPEADQAVLLFESESAAQDDAEARPAYLDEFVATYDLGEVDFEVETDGAAVVVDADGERAGRVLVDASLRGEGPVACAADR